MSDIKFNCPHCSSRLSAPVAALGRKINCPRCGGHIELPAHSGMTAPDDTVVEGRRIANVDPQHPADIKFACPNCNVNIVVAQRAAGKVVSCQLCGARVRVPQPGAPTAAPASASFPPARPVRTSAPSPEEAELIERVRNGDAQAGRTLLMTGKSAIQLLADSLTENSLEEPDSTRGAEHIVNLLAKCGGACVSALTAKLGRSRHAYAVMAKVGTAEAVQALVRELASVNWRRAEVACKALGQTDTPAVAQVLPRLDALCRSTRIGEVYAAASAAIIAIQERYPATSAPPPAATAQPATSSGATAPLKAAAPMRSV